MNTYADNNKENKKQQTPASIQKKNNGAVVLPVVNSPSVAAQMQLQEIANNSPQVKQAVQLQAMVNTHNAVPIQKKDLITTTQSVFQLQKLEAGKLNLVGEHHSESNERRQQEIDLAAREVGGEYWTENNFRIRETNSPEENAVKDTAKDPRILGDALYLRIAESIQYVYDAKNNFEKEWTHWTTQNLPKDEFSILKDELQHLLVTCKTHTLEANRLAKAYMDNEEYKTLPKFVTDQIIQIHKLLPKTKELFLILVETWKNHTLEQLILNRFLSSFNVFGSNIDVLNMYAAIIGGASRTDTSKLRSYEMDNAADFAHDRIGVWKIGFDHVKDIKDEMQHNDTKNYVLINREEFNHEYKELPILVDGHMVQQTIQLQVMVNTSSALSVQKKANKDEEMLQKKIAPIQKKANNTGLPDNLKSGIENLSGYSMDDIKVHYNSDKPAELQAHAYAQGTDIHIASGQEEHLPHEAWHVVQQKQGRVKPTFQMKGDIPVNNDVGLENEADFMGAKAIQFTGSHSKSILQRKVEMNTNQSLAPTIQLMKKWTLAGGFEDIEQVPEGQEDVWLKCKYKEEETYINIKDIERFTSTDWDDITYYEEENADLAADEDVVEEDKFPGLEKGEVTSITIIKESKSDHQYVIVMVKGGGNIKMHYGVAGGLCKRHDDIDNEHGIPLSRFDPPKGLTGDEVIQIFETTKAEIAVNFTGGNCGGLANDLVGRLGGKSQKGNDAYDLFL